MDTVLYFEGDRTQLPPGSRHQNRFGAVNEIGVFAMTEKRPQGRHQPEARFSFDPRQASAGQLCAGDAGRHAAAAGGTTALVDSGGVPARDGRRWPGPDRLAMLLARPAPPRQGGHRRPGRVRQRRGRRAISEPAPTWPCCGHSKQPARQSCRVAIAFAVGLPWRTVRPRAWAGAAQRSQAGLQRAIVPKANAPKKPIGA